MNVKRVAVVRALFLFPSHVPFRVPVSQFVLALSPSRVPSPVRVLARVHVLLSSAARAPFAHVRARVLVPVPFVPFVHVPS